jgi:hypothetical protein
MTDESTFRVLFTVIFAGSVLIWGPNFLSVGLSRYALYTTTEGPLVAVPLRLLLGASLVSIVYIAYMGRTGRYLPRQFRR